MFRRLLPAEALAATLAAPAAALDLDQMTAEERAAFGEAVRAYLLENPQVIMEAVQVLEERQQAEQAAADVDLVMQNAEALFDDGYSWVGGNPEGDITVVEFLDYRCGFCRRAHPEVAELIESDGNIRLIVKEYPILGEESLLAARFAMAVLEVEGGEAYKDINDTLMTMRGNVTEAGLSDLSEEKGYDTPAVFDAMNSEALQQRILDTRALAQRLAINGTPTFVFGDQLVRGYVPLDGMREIVEAERAEG